jgi:hypothetical protein
LISDIYKNLRLSRHKNGGDYLKAFVAKCKI